MLCDKLDLSDSESKLHCKLYLDGMNDIPKRQLCCESETVIDNWLPFRQFSDIERYTGKEFMMIQSYGNGYYR